MRVRSPVTALAASVLAAFFFAAPIARADEWQPGKTFALLVGVLEWKDPSLASFPKDGRVDRILEATLARDGVPQGNVRFLEDRNATLAAIRKELALVLERAGEDSTLVFYFAGHGLQEDGGKTFLANYDCDTKDDARTAFGVAELQKTLHAKFRGKRLLLLADCCHSGALADVVKSFDETKVKAACLTSATASNISTGAWTFTQSVVAAFSRDGVLDADRNGTITFAETDDFVHREMRWKENQLTRGARSRAFEADFALGKVDPARVVADVPGPWKLRAYAECEWNGEWFPVQLLEHREKDGAFKVHYLGYKASDDEWVAPARLRTAPALDVNAGDACEVEWKGKWWPAKIAQVDECFAFIHYDGFGREWDEWVTPKRLRAAGAKGEKKKKRGR